MQEQIEIETKPRRMPKHTSDFLLWLDRFAFVGVVRKTIERYRFSEDELNQMRPQITANYRLKVKYMRRKAGA